MPIITGAQNVRNIYASAARRGWLIPCFCSENLVTSEAILASAQRAAERLGCRVPVSVAITCRYAHRSQATNYTMTRNWDTGLRLWRADMETLCRADGDFPDVDVLLHLDHIQYDDDLSLTESDLSWCSSIMYDASAADFASNMRHTAEFVRRCSEVLLIEGACDEIVDATGTVHNELTTADRAEEYLRETGVDLIVCNLGTEHRATAKNLRYDGDAARAIKEKIGSRIVLHGTSSVPNSQIHGLFGDGVCKVNIWTALERDSTPALFEAMVREASSQVGGSAARALCEKGLLGPAASLDGPADIARYTDVYRRGVIFERMSSILDDYFNMWYLPAEK